MVGPKKVKGKRQEELQKAGSRQVLSRLSVANSG